MGCVAEPVVIVKKPSLRGCFQAVVEIRFPSAAAVSTCCSFLSFLVLFSFFLPPINMLPEKRSRQDRLSTGVAVGGQPECMAAFHRCRAPRTLKVHRLGCLVVRYADDRVAHVKSEIDSQVRDRLGNAQSFRYTSCTFAVRLRRRPGTGPGRELTMPSTWSARKRIAGELSRSELKISGCACSRRSQCRHVRKRCPSILKLPRPATTG